ncbi:hypothetical protein FALCPG4_017634 [Fusarium falciforme]
MNSKGQSSTTLTSTTSHKSTSLLNASSTFNMKFSALAIFALASLAVAAPAPEADGDMSLSDVTELIKKGEAKVEIANAKECKYRCCNNFGWCPCC